VTFTELRALVMESAPKGLKEDFLLAALSDVLAEGPLPPDEEEITARVIRRAKVRQAAYAEEECPFGLSWPFDLLTSDLLAKKITPWVEELREKGFGARKPPFTSYEEAVRWIEETSAQDKASFLGRFREGEREKAFEQIESLAKQYGIDLTLQNRTLPYPGRDGWRKLVPVWPGTFLAQLEYETRKMSEATGFNQAMLVMTVLHGLKPLLARTTITTHLGSHKLPTGETLQSRAVTVKFLARDITFEELHGVYEQVKAFLAGKRAKGVTQESWELYRLVEKHGGPPQEDKTRFWEKIQGAWNRGHPDHQFRTWQGVRKAYLDLLNRVEKAEKESAVAATVAATAAGKSRKSE